MNKNPYKNLLIMFNFLLLLVLVSADIEIIDLPQYLENYTKYENASTGYFFLPLKKFYYHLY